MNNGKNLSLGETVWYDDAYGRPTKCVVDAIESRRLWVRVQRSGGRVYFEESELDQLRSTEELRVSSV